MKARNVIVGYAVYCAAMTLASRTMPQLPASLVPLFNFLQSLNLLFYIPNSPALMAFPPQPAVPVANNSYSLPQLTITG